MLLGAGAGLSTSAGFTYVGEQFHKYFSDFIEKYHFTDMYTADFHRFPTLEEHWAYWAPPDLLEPLRARAEARV